MTLTFWLAAAVLVGARPLRRRRRCASSRSTTSRATSRSGSRCATSPTPASSCSHRASRRREQRAAGDAESRPGLPHRAGDGDARQRRPERDRPGDLRGARRAADRASSRRCTASTAPSSTSRARSTSAISFSIDETFEKWGRDEITADYVRLIRTIRPDVIIAHAADRQRRRPAPHGVRRSSTRDAYKLAGDPTKYPEQIKDGLRPWQPKKLLSPRGLRRSAASRQPAGKADARINLARLRRAARQDLLGDRHRSAQHAQVPGHGAAAALPGAVGAAPISWSRSTIAGADAEGRDVAVRRRRHQRSPAWRSSPARARRRISPTAWPRSRQRSQAAQKEFDTGDDDGDAAAAARRPARRPRAARPAAHDGDRRRRRSSRSISACARRKREFQQAIILANGIRIEALADDGVVVPGQAVKVTCIVANRGARRGRRSSR